MEATDFCKRREASQPIGDHLHSYSPVNLGPITISGKEKRGHGGKFIMPGVCPPHRYRDGCHDGTLFSDSTTRLCHQQAFSAKVGINLTCTPSSERT